jgi:hypothetical protein
MFSLGFWLWNDNIDKGASTYRTSSSEVTSTTTQQQTIVFICREGKIDEM